jgi:hypothetical protein
VAVSRLSLRTALLFACFTLAACGGGLSTSTLAAGRKASTASPGHQAGSPFRFFSPRSIWNSRLSASSPLSPNSAAVVNALAEEVDAEQVEGRGPYINTTRYSVPIYTVPADQPMVRVALRHRSASLQAALSEVPLPANAQPAAGTDGHLVVWQPSTDRLWEFWQLTQLAGGWQASWGGAMRNVAFSSGVYSRRSWPGASSSWGASASALSIAGGLITLEDLAAGRIDHALALSLPNVRAGVFAEPASHTDGATHDTLALPEGAHLRLDPKLDLARLHLPHPTLMLAEAAQRYGIVIRDRAGEVTFYAQDPIPAGIEPYGGVNGYFEGRTPSRLLASFPWSHLQLLKMKLHSRRLGG